MGGVFSGRRILSLSKGAVDAGIPSRRSADARRGHASRRSRHRLWVERPKPRQMAERTESGVHLLGEQA